MKLEFPIGSHLLLYRRGGKWVVIPSFPAGYTIPAAAISFDLKSKPDLKFVYEAFSSSYEDPQLEAGYAPGKDETSSMSSIPDGSLVVCERHAKKWTATIHYPDQGMSMRSAPYRSFADIVENLPLNYNVS